MQILLLIAAVAAAWMLAATAAAMLIGHAIRLGEERAPRPAAAIAAPVSA